MPLAYNDAIAALNRAVKFGINPSLGPITKMCENLVNPQNEYKCIQVAGSNGKSSTARIAAALLRACGCKVGLYTSPHLVKYPERIEIDGAVVGDRDFAEAIEAAMGAAGAAGIEATEFELLTAAALWLFAREKVEWAVLECGLGGRWDATSVVAPKVAVITGLALEHTDVLGSTLEEIAAEKAAIIKPGCTPVFAYGLPALEVFDARAKGVGAEPVVASQFIARDYVDAMRHLPAYQDANFATALAAVQAGLGGDVAQDAVRAALKDVVVPGRFECLRANPLLIVDAAHNPQSAQVLADELTQRFITATAPETIRSAQTAAGRPKIPALLLGVLADKDVRGVVEALCPLFERVVVTASRSPRAISARRLARIVTEATGRQPEIAESIPAALKLLDGVAVIATGSVTVAGEVKRFW